jgi:hypothetical protein
LVNESINILKNGLTFKRVFDLFSTRSDISLLYENKYGVKCFNQLVSSDLFEYFGSTAVFELSCDQLYIAFDGLNDQYTLLNTCILNSPHFDLVKCLTDNGDLRSCSYVERVQKGILDFRASQRINNRYLINLNNKFAQKKSAIQNNNYDPVKIVKVFDKYYIADGKHTAATCALLNIPVRCTDCAMVVFDSFFWWIYRKMLKNKKMYGKHLNYFESILEYYGKSKRVTHAI